MYACKGNSSEIARMPITRNACACRVCSSCVGTLFLLLPLAMRVVVGYAALALELCFCCYHWHCVWLLGMPLMANSNLIVAIQNTQPPLTASFLPVESTQNHNRPLARLRLIGRSFIFALFPLFFTVYFRSIRHHMV